MNRAYLMVVFTVLFTSQLQAKIIAVVSSVEGKAFYSHKGETKRLRVGMHLPSQVEIFTEMGAQLSINDYYDHIYHLAGAGHIVLHPNLVELKEGYLWMKSLNYDPLQGPLKVMTANAVAQNTVGEGIISFDTFSGKSQILAVVGDFEFLNSHSEFKMTDVKEGEFSFISNEHNEGAPRRPTPIGYSSYQKVTGLFHAIEAREHSNSPSETKMNKASQKSKRSIASVSEDDPFTRALGDIEQGKIKFIRSQESESEKMDQEKKVLSDYYDKIQKLAKKSPTSKKKWSPNYNTKSHVEINVYGIKKEGSRFPASVRPAYAPKTHIHSSRTPASIGAMTPKIDSAFEKGLTHEYKRQMRHKKEVNQLIDQLKSVDMDYKKDY